MPKKLTCTCCGERYEALDDRIDTLNLSSGGLPIKKFLDKGAHLCEICRAYITEKVVEVIDVTKEYRIAIVKASEESLSHPMVSP